MSKSARSIVELKDYVDTLARHLKEYVNTRFSAVDDAVRLANDAMQVRLEHLNNLYQQINHMGESYPTKNDLQNLSDRYDLSVKQIDSDIRYLRESKAEIAGKASAESVNEVRETVARNQMFVMVGLGISLLSLSCGAIGTLVAVVGMVMKFIWT